MAVNAQIKNFDKLKSSIEGIKGKAEKATSNTVKDMKSRAPGWIATSVTKRYNIKKGEITPQSKSAKSPQHKSASIKTAGDTIETLAFYYKGRLLTPTRFAMKPGKRPDGKKPYQVSAEIVKGKRKVLGMQVFLGSSGGSGDIPFQRVSASRLPIESIKTVSVPQMIMHEDVAVEIQNSLSAGLKTRLEHNIKRQKL